MCCVASSSWWLNKYVCMYGMYVYSKWFVYASGSDHPITYARGSEWIANNKRDEKRTGFLIRRTARVKYRAYNSTVSICVYVRRNHSLVRQKQGALLYKVGS